MNHVGFKMWMKTPLSSDGNGYCILLLVLLHIQSSCEYAAPPSKRQGWQPYCPVACICHYTSVYCDSQGLRRVPRPFPASTAAIYMRDNFIRRVPYRRMRGLTNLKHLLLKANHIVEVEGHAFKDLKNLISLSLTDNNLSYLSPKIFQSQKNLQVLSLRNNRIRHVKSIFNNVHKLQLLNLANNRIRHITNDMLKNMPLLRVLDLHGNNIKHLASDTFHNLHNLRFLVLRDNDFGLISFEFPRTVHLELLDLTNCNLKHIPEGLPNTINDLRLSENQIGEVRQNDFNTTKQIRLLVLNNNKIEKIHPKALSGLLQLYDLYLGKNKLTRVPYGLPKSIHGIYANFNNITAIIEGSFSYQSHLEFLFLRNNNIKKIDQTAFQGLRNLRSLDLSRNQVMSLKPHTFSKLRTLELLDLSKNPIGDMEYGCFHGLHKLTILQLSSVDTKSLVPPSSFRDMHNLRFLDLSNSASLVKKMAKNRITLKSLKSVEDLNMMNDLLDTLPPDFPNHFPVLRVIKLIGNPWHCDEKIFWLTDWMRNRTITFYAPHFMVCATPKILAGKQILTLQKSEVFKANRPAPKPKPTKSVIRKIRVDNLGVIFKIIESDKEYISKGPAKRIPFRTRQGLSNTAIRITPSDVVVKLQNTSKSDNHAIDKHTKIETKEISVKITPVKSVQPESNNLFDMLKSKEDNNEIRQFPGEIDNTIRTIDSETQNQIPSPNEIPVIPGQTSTKVVQAEDIGGHIKTGPNKLTSDINDNNLDSLSKIAYNIASTVKNRFNRDERDNLDNSKTYDDDEISNVIQKVPDYNYEVEDEDEEEEDISEEVITTVTPDEIELAESEEQYNSQNSHVHKYTKRSQETVTKNYHWQEYNNRLFDAPKRQKYRIQYAGYPGSNSGNIAYNDRIFENVQQAERFLLQTYSNTIKRKYKDTGRNVISQDNNSVLKDKNEVIQPYSSQVKNKNRYIKLRTEGQPLYDDSSGHKNNDDEDIV